MLTDVCTDRVHSVSCSQLLLVAVVSQIRSLPILLTASCSCLVWPDVQHHPGQSFPDLRRDGSHFVPKPHHRAAGLELQQSEGVDKLTYHRICRFVRACGSFMRQMLVFMLCLILKCMSTFGNMCCKLSPNAVAYAYARMFGMYAFMCICMFDM